MTSDTLDFLHPMNCLSSNKAQNTKYWERKKESNKKKYKKNNTKQWYRRKLSHRNLDNHLLLKNLSNILNLNVVQHIIRFKLFQ